MADSLFALADLLKINDSSLADIDVSDLTTDAPFMAALGYQTATHGTIHKYTKETAAPVVGFRDANAGRDLSKSGDTEVTATLKILDFTFEIDKAIADAYTKGGAVAKVAREAIRHLKAAMFAYETQLLSTQASGGFVGLPAVLAALEHAMVVNAAGTTADTGSSIYMIRVGDDDVSGVLGNDGVFDLGETTVGKRVVDPGTDNKSFPTYYTPGTGYCGLQIGGAKSVGRIANITADSDKSATDDLLFELFERFPAGRKPTHVVMGSRSQEQIRTSRTATNATGAPAPIPVEWNGRPLIVTDAIGKAEAIIAAA